MPCLRSALSSRSGSSAHRWSWGSSNGFPRPNRNTGPDWTRGWGGEEQPRDDAFPGNLAGGRRRTGGVAETVSSIFRY